MRAAVTVITGSHQDQSSMSRPCSRADLVCAASLSLTFVWQRGFFFERGDRKELVIDACVSVGVLVSARRYEIGWRMCVCVHCRFVSAYCGCAFLHECLLFVRLFSPPTVDWLNRLLSVRLRRVSLVTSLEMSERLLVAHKATWCFASRRKLQMMKRCALPNRKASFTPWYLLSSRLLLPPALLSCSFPPGCSRLTLYYRLSHSKPVSYLSIQPVLTAVFVVINQNIAARKGRGKPSKLSKQVPPKGLQL